MSDLSVTFSCGQTVGRIKMKLGKEVGLGPPHCVRWGPMQPPTGHSPQFSACLLWPLGRAVCLGPGHIVLDGDPAPLKMGAAPPLFGPCLLWENGWIDQDAIWDLVRR